MELQLALDAVQPVGLNVTAQVDTQQVQEVQAVNEAPHPVQQMDTEIRNPFPVASAQPNFSQLCSDSKSPIEDMKLPYNNEVVDLETIGYYMTDADTHTLAENFNGTGKKRYHHLVNCLYLPLQYHMFCLNL